MAKNLLNLFLLIILSAGFFRADFIFGQSVQTTSADSETKIGKIVINEIAWMGTAGSYNDEWVELYNPNPWPIVLDGWLLKSEDDSPKIILSGRIEGQSFFLLERTDDSTLPEVAADQIYKGGLSNLGESLVLLDKQGQLIDKVDCSLNWFAGENETKKTMERTSPLGSGSEATNWKTSQKSGGTPRAQNSPQRKTNQQKLTTAYASSKDSMFFFVLSIGLTISLFISMLVLVFWLKFKPKQSNISL